MGRVTVTLTTSEPYRSDPSASAPTKLVPAYDAS